MIEVREGNVLAVPEGIIVHGCNCQGVMGAGIAAQIKQLYPVAYQIYRDKYLQGEHEQSRDGGLFLGGITYAQVGVYKWIVNANTQDRCGGGKRYVNYEAVAQCFEKVRKFAENTGHLGKKLDIFFPMIGAGLAGGNWDIISTIIDVSIGDEFNKILYVYKP